MKKKKRAHKHYAGRKGADAAELSARLAPLEEHDGAAAQTDTASSSRGTIVVDTGKLKLPETLLEKQEAARQIFGVEPVIVVILFAMLAFIALIAYLISQMPGPAQ